MLELSNVKSISGNIALPPNPDFFLLTLVFALATGRKTHIDPIPETPLIELYRELFENQLAITKDDSGYTVESVVKEGSSFILLPYNRIPYCDFITFAFLGMQKTVGFKDLPVKRLEAWNQKAAAFNCAIETKQFDEALGLSFASGSDLTTPSENKVVDMDTIQALLGIALGMKKPISFTIDQHFQTPLRHLFAVFGYDITVKNTFEQKKPDPLMRRLQLMTSRFKKSQDQKASFSFTVSIAMNKTQSDTIAIGLPGDDILGALLLLAKCLIQRGQLIVENVPLEPWCSAMLNHIRKMGCVPGIQQNRQTALGAAGAVTLQKFKLVGRKTDCRPLFLYDRHLPALVVLSSFAVGQSVFRHVEDLRNEDPDRIEQYLGCVRMLGARHGEMPDGMVIDGAKHYDGFDCAEPLSAGLGGACAIAGLRCGGKTTVEDSRILERWPDFKKILERICE